ncbi:MAG: lipase family protein [Pseudomonadales bacterium]
MNPKQAAQWASLAYEDEEIGQKMASEWGFSFVLFSSGPHQCIVCSRDGETVVAFRGTQIKSVRDLLTNLKSRQIKNKAGPGKVHQGYHNAAWSLVPLFKHLLTGRVVFVGHSMGGCLAIQAGSICRKIVNAVYTFNAPKSGDPEFADAYIAQVFRFASKRDFAQSYPSDEPCWKHVGSKITLASTGHSMDRIVAVL